MKPPAVPNMSNGNNTSVARSRSPVTRFTYNGKQYEVKQTRKTNENAKEKRLTRLQSHC
jgi:hypothetical protein